ncbi:MAG: hypothetical protein V3W14_04480 [Candidatus Neomarinimicrobiota bacterium]
MLIIWLITVALLTLGILERRRHQIRVDRIPVRLHISGTRGKSLLTRMITDLFDQAGWSVTAKITGAKPKVFSAATGWIPWRRRVPARIKEQLRIVRQASCLGSQALVVENMALRPENQHAAESQMIQSNLGIITNFRPDHQEVAASDTDDIPAALAYSFARDNVLLLPERELTPAIQSRVDSLHTMLITARPAPWLPETIHPVFGSQFALLKAAQEHYSLPDAAYGQAAAKWRERLCPESFLLPFPGVDKARRFVDLFSCNDVASAQEIVRWLESCQLIHPPYDILLTCRADRPLRTRAFLEWLLPALGKGQLIITGSFPLLLVNRLRRKFGVSAQAIRKYTRINPGRILSELAHRKLTVLGLGNYVATGEEILSNLKKDLA